MTKGEEMNASFAKTNIAMNLEFVEKYEIYHVPTVLMFSHGVVVEHTVDSDFSFR